MGGGRILRHPPAGVAVYASRRDAQVASWPLADNACFRGPFPWGVGVFYCVRPMPDAPFFAAPRPGHAASKGLLHLTRIGGGPHLPG